MTDVPWQEIEQEFHAAVRRVVWCTVATVDTKGRPRGRILHPIWEDRTGWIMTGRHSLKGRHLLANPHVSLTYWQSLQDFVVQVEATASWEDSAPEKQRIWALFRDTPPPAGYDPADFWPDGAESPNFGVLKLLPRRIELSGAANIAAGKPYSQVWRP